MKEVIVHPSLATDIVSVDIPTPSASQVLIKVIVSGTNPKDWKYPEWLSRAMNSGDDIAGIVEAVGSGVTAFKKGDRVAAFHQMNTPHGSFAEYAIAWDWTTFHLPENTSFEEAATIPLVAMTAAIGLFYHLRLPAPFRPATEPTPIVIYGGSSSVGAFAIKLARAANIHPIITTAGAGSAFVESLLDPSKGDVFIDYRKGKEATVAAIKDALQKAGFQHAKHAYDAISESASHDYYLPTLSPEGAILATVLPTPDVNLPAYVQKLQTNVAVVHNEAPADSEEAKSGCVNAWKQFGFVYFQLFALGLKQGWLAGHPYTIVPGGLDGVGNALVDLKSGKASATKLLVRIAETS
ncbi:hypothetical protein BP5796_03618 [Coleophoma crateriformis]|uniref:Enoyl reductase (ER) domain-containing protein n=1 Tax=Coleophoma crateriformis TaxID=565419 RepID=A0A3D8SP13_9HELO|nr:hypothetical protein BP5796_03618 [Coleophoma crateriformis]